MEASERKNPFKGVRAIVFDFDGTLAVLNIDFSLMRKRVFDLMKNYDISEGWVEEKYLLEIIDEVYQFLWERNPSSADDFYQKAHEILYEIEIQSAEKGSLIPGVEETLKHLRGKRIKIGIVTRNCEDAVRKVFPDINDFCDVFVSRNSVKKVKPHPDHLTHVMASLKTSVAASVMVGDHPIDIQVGKRVGMKTIGVLTGRTKKEEFEKAGADYILRSASEVCDLLEG
jgi:phosphoglycolate phosphatase